MNARTNAYPGPRVFRLRVQSAGPVEHWGEWLERTRSLECTWLWLDGLQPRDTRAHPSAVMAPGELRPDLSGGADAMSAVGDFLADAHAAGLKVAMDFAPAWVARSAALVERHPDWFVAGPDGAPAVPRGLGDRREAAALAACDFGGPQQGALEAFWSSVAAGWIGCGFDALICRAAHRLSAASWQAVLGEARRVRPEARFWADTLGAPVEASEALAPVGFDAFFSSACWWDFRAAWFLEQEARLRRLAPTIAFPEPPGDSSELGDETRAGAVSGGRLRFRFGFAASIAWGVVLPMEYAAPAAGKAATKRGPRPRENDAAIAAINRLKRDTPAFDGPARLSRVNAPDAVATVLAATPVAEAAPAAVIALNPDPARHADVPSGPLFARLDAAGARARELTPGRTPQQLDAAGRIALEPGTLRWFELTETRVQTRGKRREPPPARAPIVAIENVAPQLDAGRFPVKRVLGEAVRVEADLVAEGHAPPAAALRWRGPGADGWQEGAFVFFDNDRWRGTFTLESIGRWTFQVIAWRNRYGEWRQDMLKRRDAGQPLELELAGGGALLAEAVAAADARARARLEELAGLLSGHGKDIAARAELLLAETTAELIESALPREGLSYSPEFDVLVERGRARTGAWYECFPRSLGEPGRHGTFDDLARHLPYIAGLGFDVLYLPPIHPIGTSFRKGRNNALDAGPGDPGSPWAIGSKDGGHTAIHPQLGTLEDFRRLLDAARRAGLEVAMDFAIQCSPDHPWVKEHPEWFRWRPDGTIRYAENPPKKYQDIVNVDFFCKESASLWRALLDVLLYWCEQGVRIFRVDNPHTKALGFWEWALAAVRERYPETVFLAEAFTRPKLMHELAKLGFSQSYTYFTWRETKAELAGYLGELTTGASPEYFRPNFWVNTPDINPHHLHHSGRAGFVIRAALAATLAPSWGLYSGYELCEAEPLLDDDGSEREEYLDSEKYELRHRDFNAPGNIRAEIAALNRIRRDNPAFDGLTNLRFHAAGNDQVLFYSRWTAEDCVWVLVSLDPHQAQEAGIELPLDMIGADEDAELAVEDLFAGGNWRWQGRRQRVRLEPARPAMILRVTKGGERDGG